MESLGQVFRAAREAKSLSIDEIASETRISASYLHALEKGDESAFPGPFFYRSFIRQYARILEVPESAYQSELERSLQAEEETMAALPTQLVERHIDVPPMPSAARGLREDTRRWLLRLGGLALVLAGCTGLYEGWLRLHVATPASPPVQVSQSKPPEIAQPPVVPSAPVAPATEPAPVPAPEKPQAQPVTGAVQLSLKAIELTWLEAISGGKRIYMGVMQPGESRILASDLTIRMKLGNAGGLEIQLNGKPVPAPGPSGQVRLVDFNAGGYEVVPPPPPAPKPDDGAPLR